LKQEVAETFAKRSSENAEQIAVRDSDRGHALQRKLASRVGQPWPSFDKNGGHGVEFAPERLPLTPPTLFVGIGAKNDEERGNGCRLQRVLPIGFTGEIYGVVERFEPRDRLDLMLERLGEGQTIELSMADEKP
jgi:hypothetical protein